MDGDQSPSAGSEADSPTRTRGRMRWIGAGVAVVVIAIVAIVLASGGGGGGGPLNAIAKAAEVTEQEPGGHATITGTVTSSTQPEGITESGSMVFDESGKAEGTVTATAKPGEEVTVKTIVVGTEAYTSSDKFDSLPEGKKWIGLDLSSVAAEADASTSTAGGPSEGLKILETVEDAEKVGKDEIDGVPTTRYRGTLPIAKEVFGVKLHATAQQVEVWIDAEGRVRRMHIVVSGSVGESKESATTDMTIDYTEFGSVPTIKPPAPDEVFDATSQIESEFQTIH